VGSVKTVNNNPTAQLKGTFTGTNNGLATTASGTLSSPLSLQDAGGGSATISGLASGTAKVGGTNRTLKPTTTNFPVTATQKTNLSKSWSLDLNIKETNSTPTKKLVLASAILSLPSGDKTFFKEKTLTFSIKNGYSVSYTRGIKLDGAGNPIIDPKTLKPVIDTKSTVTITKMIITGSPSHWIVAGGTISYSFLGQKGTAQLMDFTGTDVTLLDNWNTGAVFNNPTTATTFTANNACVVTYINTYHWNSGQGAAAPGQLSLRHQDGTVYGPWKAKGSAGQGGVHNAVWECRPLVLIKAGTYTVVDSLPGTWSQNSTSGGRGFSKVTVRQ
jgi:hypothetical protein